MADDLNRSGVEVVFLQHEFGIFGGESGAHLLVLLRRLAYAGVSQRCTRCSRSPRPAQKRVLDEIIRISASP